MKKNIQINLYGTLYNIDEDAYQLLDNYLESMKRYFSTQEIGNEIADDIEHRVAELLWQKQQEGMQAVNVDIIKEIIGKIGNPQEINDEGATTGEEQPTGNADGNTEQHEGKKRDWQENLNDMADSATNGARNAFNNVKSSMAGKKLFRDPSNKVLGGVCSGLANYFGGDPILWRIILLLVFLLEGFGLILYLIMWVIVPSARTPEDRLRMRGEPVNPNTLNEQILRDQHNQPVTSSGNGCAKGCLFVLLLPLIFFIVITLFTVVMGLFGASVGMLGGTVSLLSIPAMFAGGTAMSHILLGVVFMILSLIIGIYLIVCAVRSTPTKNSTKWIGIIALVVCLFLCVSNMVKGVKSIADNGLEWFGPTISYTYSSSSGDEATPLDEEDEDSDSTAISADINDSTAQIRVGNIQINSNSNGVGVKIK